MTPHVDFKVVGQEPKAELYRGCRRMLVGPWCNQPEEYEGYNGFVGWMGVTILRSGRWLLTFSSGYWHASFPLTEEVLKNPECRALFDEYRAMGCPYVRAPRGGRAHIMHSEDQGRTWSKPETLIDTELDDRHPTILELDDGTLLCTFFDYALPRFYSARYMRSTDGGKTWTKPGVLGGKGGGFGAGPAIQLPNGTVLWVAEGQYDPKASHNVIGVFGSTDRGKTFELLSVVNSGHEMNEPTIARHPDGRLVLLARRLDDICWSEDNGRTWTEPVSFGVDVFDPHLVMMPNGVLACFHGSYATGGLRVILSKDFGMTWHGAGERYGYCVDPSVYGYCHPVLLPDGTVYVAYIHSGGHSSADARTEALWALRVRVHDAADGIDILPAPGSPVDAGLQGLTTHGGDPALGDRF